MHDLGVPPSQDASDHQDFHIFSRGFPPALSFATVTGKGAYPTYNHENIYIYMPLVMFVSFTNQRTN